LFCKSLLATQFPSVSRITNIVEGGTQKSVLAEQGKGEDSEEWLGLWKGKGRAVKGCGLRVRGKGRSSWS
jgi:hypothetical protein